MSFINPPPPQTKSSAPLSPPLKHLYQFCLCFFANCSHEYMWRKWRLMPDSISFWQWCLHVCCCCGIPTTRVTLCSNCRAGAMASFVQSLSPPMFHARKLMTKCHKIGCLQSSKMIHVLLFCKPIRLTNCILSSETLPNGIIQWKCYTREQQTLYTIATVLHTA